MRLIKPGTSKLGLISDNAPSPPFLQSPSPAPTLQPPVDPACGATLTDFQELTAPAAWQVVDFISDLHLQSAEMATFSAWQNYLQTTPADAIFILGDLFEVWVGDDAAGPPAPPGFPNSAKSPSGGFEQQCANALMVASRRAAVFFMHGNRDFLVGEAFLAQCGTQLLADPTVLVLGGQRWLLSHGDALCLADTDYQRFRTQVRSAAWQHDFLSKPLAERISIARGLRAQSEARKQQSAALQTDNTAFWDVDAPAAAAWLAKTNAPTLIHGHTHRPGEHVLAAVAGLGASQPALQRVVLSDWDAVAQPPRLEVLRLSVTSAALQGTPLESGPTAVAGQPQLRRIALKLG